MPRMANPTAIPMAANARSGMIPPTAPHPPSPVRAATKPATTLPKVPRKNSAITANTMMTITPRALIPSPWARIRRA